MMAMIVVVLISGVGSTSTFLSQPLHAQPRHTSHGRVLSSTTPTHVRHFGRMRACHVVIVSCKVLVMADTLADGKRVVQPYPCLTPPQAYTASVT
jgi:hypothetical protein